MRLVSKVVVGGLAAIGALVVAMQFLHPFIIDCEVTPLAAAESPNGLWVARAATEICRDRARSGFFVELGPADRSRSVELLRAPATSTDVRLTWTPQGNLRIGYPENLPVTKSAPDVDGVEIILDPFTEGDHGPRN